jgi:hypothetical protein
MDEFFFMAALGSMAISGAFLFVFFRLLWNLGSFLKKKADMTYSKQQNQKMKKMRNTKTSRNSRTRLTIR